MKEKIKILIQKIKENYKLFLKKYYKEIINILILFISYFSLRLNDVFVSKIIGYYIVILIIIYTYKLIKK